MRTIQLLGVPAGARGSAGRLHHRRARRAATARRGGADVARRFGLAARRGAQQYRFKYCSTFDSPTAGTSDLDRCAAGRFGRASPCSIRRSRPTSARSTRLFSLATGCCRSGARHHPLTPMTDPSGQGSTTADATQGGPGSVRYDQRRLAVRMRSTSWKAPVSGMSS
jgi:uncharacterized protein YgbK (DUF1537 family)